MEPVITATSIQWLACDLRLVEKVLVEIMVKLLSKHVPTAVTSIQQSHDQLILSQCLILPLLTDK